MLILLKVKNIALSSWENVVMSNITEEEYRKLHSLYPGKICKNNTSSHCFNYIGGKTSLIGRSISTYLGFKKKLYKEKPKYS